MARVDVKFATVVPSPDVLIVTVVPSLHGPVASVVPSLEAFMATVVPSFDGPAAAQCLICLVLVASALLSSAFPLRERSPPLLGPCGERVALSVCLSGACNVPLSRCLAARFGLAPSEGTMVSQEGLLWGAAPVLTPWAHSRPGLPDEESL